jgi:hypothetical protein
MIKAIPYPLRNLVSGIVRPVRLRRVGPWLPKIALGWQELKRKTHSLKIHWGRVLLLAIALVLAMGEFSPAASAIARLP